MTTTYRALARIAAPIVLITTLTACASGTSSSGLNRTQLDAKANAICAAANAKSAKIPTPAAFNDQRIAAPYFDKILPISTAATQQLHALHPDKSVAADWQAFLFQRDAGQSLLENVTRLIDNKDRAGLTELSRGASLSANLDAAAKAIGATECAP
jgi:hypothetical protein